MFFFLPVSVSPCYFIILPLMKLILLFFLLFCINTASGEYYTFYINIIANQSNIHVNATFDIQIQDSYSPIYVCESHYSNYQWRDVMMINKDFSATPNSYTNCTNGCQINGSQPQYDIHFRYGIYEGNSTFLSIIDIWKNISITVSNSSIKFNSQILSYDASSMDCSRNGWITGIDNTTHMPDLSFYACANRASSIFNCESGAIPTIMPLPGATTKTTTSITSSSNTIFHTTPNSFSQSSSYSTTTSTIHPQTTDSTTLPPPIPSSLVNCTNPETQTDKIYCTLLNGTQLQPGDISSIMNDTLNSMNITTLTGRELAVAIGIFNICSKVKNMKEEDFHGMASFLDHLISAPLSAYKTGNDNNQNIGTLLLDSITQMMINSPPVVSYLSGNNIALIGRPVHCNSSNPNLYGISDHGGSFGETPNKDTVASISIDPITACQVNTERVFYSVYRSQKFFVGNSTHSSGLLQGNNFVFKKPAISDATTSTTVTDYNNKCAKGFLKTDESVVSATATTSQATKFARVKEFEGNFIIHKVLVDGEEKTLVNMKFSKKHYGVSLHGKMKTTWFDVSTNSWSRNTCDVKEKDGFYESSCNHLTDFTLIVDGSALDPILCNTTLEVVNYLVAIGSLVCLIILNTIYIGLVIPATKKSHVGRVMAKYLPKSSEDYSVTIYNFLQLVFFFNFITFSSEKRTTGKGGCTFVAILNYWILMSCIILSLFQSWKAMKGFAWTTSMENFFRKVTSPIYIYISTFAIPTLLAIGFGAGTKLDFFYRNDSFCWIRSDFITAGVVIPLTILGVNAIICCFIITLRLFPELKIAKLVQGASITISQGTKRDFKERIIALFFTQFTLGVPWLLQYMTLFTPSATASHYLFSIINGSQGIILLCSFGYKSYRTSKSKKNQRQTNIRNGNIIRNLSEVSSMKENQLNSNFKLFDTSSIGSTVVGKVNENLYHIQQESEPTPQTKAADNIKYLMELLSKKENQPSNHFRSNDHLAIEESIPKESPKSIEQELESLTEIMIDENRMNLIGFFSQENEYLRSSNCSPTGNIDEDREKSGNYVQQESKPLLKIMISGKYVIMIGIFSQMNNRPLDRLGSTNRSTVEEVEGEQDNVCQKSKLISEAMINKKSRSLIEFSSKKQYEEAKNKSKSLITFFSENSQENRNNKESSIGCLSKNENELNNRLESFNQLPIEEVADEINGSRSFIEQESEVILEATTSKKSRSLIELPSEREYQEIRNKSKSLIRFDSQKNSISNYNIGSTDQPAIEETISKEMNSNENYIQQEKRPVIKIMINENIGIMIRLFSKTDSQPNNLLKLPTEEMKINENHTKHEPEPLLKIMTDENNGFIIGIFSKVNDQSSDTTGSNDQPIIDKIEAKEGSGSEIHTQYESELTKINKKSISLVEFPLEKECQKNRNKSRSLVAFFPMNDQQNKNNKNLMRFFSENESQLNDHMNSTDRPIIEDIDVKEDNNENSTQHGSDLVTGTTMNKKSKSLVEFPSEKEYQEPKNKSRSLISFFSDKNNQLNDQLKSSDEPTIKEINVEKGNSLNPIEQESDSIRKSMINENTGIVIRLHSQTDNQLDDDWKPTIEEDTVEELNINQNYSQQELESILKILINESGRNLIRFFPHKNNQPNSHFDPIYQPTIKVINVKDENSNLNSVEQEEELTSEPMMNGKINRNGYSNHNVSWHEREVDT